MDKKIKENKIQIRILLSFKRIITPIHPNNNYIPI